MGELGNPFFIDITEIAGFDNLHHAEGILLEAQKRAAKLYNSQETHYLINGSTAGVLSAISGCTSYGGGILMARNSHKSAYHAVLLRGLKASYIYPQFPEKMGINGEISPESVEKALKENLEAQAVFLTSPTYDGVVSDVARIAGIVHAHGLPLIVDEAHGAHFPFSEHFPKDSVSCGADVVIHSVHKTLPALTQTALIHLNGNRIDREKIRKYLTVYQSSSPSYVLMAGLDNCMEWIASHQAAFEQFWEELQVLRAGLRSMENLKLLELPGMDESKILVSVRGTGISGQELSGILRREFHIELEMACGTYVCAITTVADTKESLERLLTAFRKVDEGISRSGEHSDKRFGLPDFDGVLETASVCTIAQAEEYPAEDCGLSQSAGRISGGFVTLYPPGIPILAPGEVITEPIVGRLQDYAAAGLEVHGMRKDTIRVLKGKREWERYFV